MRRIATSDDAYFATFTVVDWVDVFTRQEYKQYMVENLKICQERKGLILHAYVIMTNHIHLIGEIVNGKTMSDWFRDFKSFTSKGLFKLISENPAESRKQWMTDLFRKHGRENELNLDFQIWQNGSHPTVLYPQYPKMIAQKINYIHQNPVRAGFVDDPTHYLYSSAHPHSPLKMNGSCYYSSSEDA